MTVSEGLTSEEADLIVAEAIQQGWADQETSDVYVEPEAGEVEKQRHYTRPRWDRSGAAEHHDWVDGACSRCTTSRDERTENLSCPGIWVEAQPLDTYSVVLRFPGMFHSEKYWLYSTDDWRVLKAKVDELREVLKQLGERGWDVAQIGRRPKKAGKLGMYIEVVPPGGSQVYPIRVGGMRTWRKVVKEAEAIIESTPPNQELTP